MAKVLVEMMAGAAGTLRQWASPSAWRLPSVPDRFARAASASRWKILAGSALALLLILEGRTAWLQAHLFSSVAARLTWSLQPGPGPVFALSRPGPYDARLGYDKIPEFVNRLRREGWEVDLRAEPSPTLRLLNALGLPPIYPEKSGAGLRIAAHDGRPILESRFPERVYQDFGSVPPVLVRTILFIENRELLDPPGSRNPAVEWDRQGRAVLDLAYSVIDPRHPVSGGSTLATQIEKLRHSPAGRTSGVPEKLRQMAGASLRAYRSGPQTDSARRQIICDYLNTLPLGSIAGHGEVQGLGDGLWAWYEADFDRVNELLVLPETGLSGTDRERERALAYRRALSLLLAAKRPSEYLVQDPSALKARTDSYLRLLAGAGEISARLRDAALATEPALRQRAPALPAPEFVERKAPDAVRAQLLASLGVESTYTLDRLDLTARTTFDAVATKAATRLLTGLSEPSFAASQRVIGGRLLTGSTLDSVIYSFTLWERAGGANLLRVATDTYNQPFRVNEGSKLELGSTAKLRTLVTYLEIVAGLHGRYRHLGSEELQQRQSEAEDSLSRWAARYLARASDKSLPLMLEAAMNRTYSADPAEGFFTGGGLHWFSNFSDGDNGREMTVREAFHRSVNLVFIRLMRDLVHYHMVRLPGSSRRIVTDAGHPARREYLERFADYEGTKYLGRFWNKYQGKTPDEALQALLGALRLTGRRLAVIYRSVRPGDSLEQFAAFLKDQPATRSLPARAVASLYGEYGKDKLNLNDRGYLARVHPLELWLLEYLHRRRDATWEQVVAASAGERREVYEWLLRQRLHGAQNTRIRTILEIDAFAEIHKSWKRQGYPFASLVPSLATAIGSSGDNPEALAELAGIILNDGIRQPSVRIEQLHFARGMPLEARLIRKPGACERVMDPAVARVLREELLGVVEKGTAIRAKGSVVLPDGRVVPVGGKTGTGDNRFVTRTVSKSINRTAAFVFTIGDRFFGTILAYAPGDGAADHSFTSSLPVQVFKNLVPALQPLIERAPETRHGARPAT
jgi:membrane peptidoglycan carboxypeptidase